MNHHLAIPNVFTALSAKTHLARLVVLGLLVLTGCTPRIAVEQNTRNAELDAWKAHQSLVANINSWQLKGKIGVKTASKGGSATLNWVYSNDQQSIELYGPFGGGRVIITTEPGNAILKDTKGNVIEGQTAQEVLYERLGWHVPFNRLIMWSRGLPNDDVENLQFDERGFLQSLTEDIWHVEYQQYQVIDAKTASHTLPRKLTITALPGTIKVYNDDGDYLGDHLSVKVILKRWWDVKSDVN